MTPYAHHPGGFVIYAADSTGPDAGRIYAMRPGADTWTDWHLMVAKYGLSAADFTLYGYLPELPELPDPPETPADV